MSQKKRRTQLQFEVVLPNNKRSLPDDSSSRDTWKDYEKTHHCFVTGEDAMALDFRHDLAENEGLLSRLTPKTIRSYAKSILTYENGTEVSKHQGPWGDGASLHDQSFIITKKVFTRDGNVIAVHLMCKEDRREYVINNSFFDCWIDAYTLDAHFGLFSVQK